MRPAVSEEPWTPLLRRQVTAVRLDALLLEWAEAAACPTFSV